MKIAFYFPGVACNGNTPNERPLGGTESAMIYMARALAARGHDVWVFTVVDAPGLYDRVQYRPCEEFEKFAARTALDVFICIRVLLPLLVQRWARVQIYFSPDAHDQPALHCALPVIFESGTSAERFEIGCYSLRQVQRYVDAVFCVGQWQAQTFVEKFLLAPQKILVTGNGVHLPDYPIAQVALPRAPQVAYCSTPFRGLEYLLEFFPVIRARVPKATCVVLSGMQLYGQSAADDQRQFQHIYDLAKQPGVTLVGPVAKPALAQHLLASRVLAYPNTFAETFCIAALESQAAGLPVVSSHLGALPERVAQNIDGVLIPGHPEMPAYREAFIDAVVRYLTDDAAWRLASAAARAKAETFTYELLAAHWEAEFANLLQRATLRAPDAVFEPRAQRCDVLVSGYPKRVELSAAVMLKHYCQAVLSHGFRDHAAALASKLSVTTDD